MKVEVNEVGHERTRIVIIDDFMEKAAQVVDTAEAMAPFPHIADNYYPGLRRIIRPGELAYQYAEFVCANLVPVLKEVYGLVGFRLTEASFSMVTQRPPNIEMLQRVPHFDTFDPLEFAILHYLSATPQGGTGFYRHRRTGFECLSQARYPQYQAGIDADLQAYGPPAAAYMSGSTKSFERIAHVEGVFNRLAIYPGALLHSGDIPADFDFSADVRQGRLTGNIFVTGRP